MANNRLLTHLTVFFAFVVGGNANVFAEKIACASNAGKATTKVQFKIGTLSRSDDSVEVTPACSNEVLVVRKCDLAGIQTKGRQKFCYPEGRPAYSDTYDVIEYYVDEK